MSQEIKRYSMQAFGSLINPIQTYSGAWVCAADYDRAIAELSQVLDQRNGECVRLISEHNAALEALQFIMDMQIRGFIVLGDKASTMAQNALLASQAQGGEYA